MVLVCGCELSGLVRYSCFDGGWRELRVVCLCRFGLFFWFELPAGFAVLDCVCCFG